MANEYFKQTDDVYIYIQGFSINQTTTQNQAIDTAVPKLTALLKLCSVSAMAQREMCKNKKLIFSAKNKLLFLSVNRQISFFYGGKMVRNIVISLLKQLFTSKFGA